MSREIDERIVSMRFDNHEFEQEAANTMKTMEKLKNSFQMDDTADNFNILQDALNHLDISNFLHNSLFAIERFKILSNVIDNVVNKVKGAVKAMSVDQIHAGWDKYADKTSAVQTIMAATAQDFENTTEQMQYVNDQLSKLNWFTDETSYNFTDMTSNIGKFTSAGVKLDDAVASMEGIANWAGISGATITQASHAMYNLSQAMGVGAVTAIDWRSIENANMATLEFKNQVIDTAVELGTLKRGADGVVTTLNGSYEVSAENFREGLREKWFSADVLTSVLKKYGKFTEKLNEYSTEIEDTTGHYLTTSNFIKYLDAYAGTAEDKSAVVQKAMNETGMSVERLTEMFEELSKSEYDLGKRSFRAAQEAKTWKEAFDSVKDAVSTGWMNTFEIIFGDYEQAKVVWTNVANELYDVFATGGELRNSILEAWAGMLDETEHTGRDLLLGSFANIWKGFKTLLTSAKSAIWFTLTGTRNENEIIDKVATSLMNFSKWLNKATSVFILSERQINALDETFENLLVPLRVAKKLIVAIAKSFAPFGKLISFTVKTVLTDISDLSDMVYLLLDETYHQGVFSKITSSLTKVFSTVSRLLKGVVRLFDRVFDSVYSGVMEFMEAYQRRLEKSGNYLHAFLDGFYNGWKTVIHKIADLFGEITGIKWLPKRLKDLASGLQSFGSSLLNISEDAKQAFKSFDNGFEGFVGGVGTFLRDGIKSFGSWLKEVTGIEWLDGFIEYSDQSILYLQQRLIGYAQAVKAQYEESGGGIKGVLDVMLKGLGAIASKPFRFLYDVTGIEWFQTVGQAIKDFFSGIKKYTGGFAEYIKTVFETVKIAIEPFISVFKNAFSWFWGEDENELQDPLEPVADSIEKSGERIGVVYKSVAQMALEFIRGDWGNGLERDAAVLAAGYDNDLVQGVVNQIWSLGGSFKDGYEAILAEYENIDARLVKEGDETEKEVKRKGKTWQKYARGQAGAYEEVEEAVRDVNTQFSDAKQKILEALPGIITKVGESIGKAKLKVDAAKKSIIAFVEKHRLIDKIVEFVPKAFSKIGSIFSSISDFFKKNSGNIKNTFLALYNGAKKVFTLFKSSKAEGAISNISTFVTKIKDTFSKAFEGVGTELSTALEFAANDDWIGARSHFGEAFKKTATNVSDMIKSFVNDLRANHPVFDKIVTALEKTKDKLVSIFTSIVDFFKRHAPEFQVFGSKIWEGLQNGWSRITESFGGIGEFFSSHFEGFGSLLDALTTAFLTMQWPDLKETAVQCFEQIGTFIKEGVEKAIGIAGEALLSLIGFGSGIVSFVQDIFGAVLGAEEDAEGEISSQGSLATVFSNGGEIGIGNFTLLAEEMTQQLKETGTIDTTTIDEFKGVFNDITTGIGTVAEIYKDYKLARMLGKLGGLFKGTKKGIKSLSDSFSRLITLFEDVSKGGIKGLIEGRSKMKIFTTTVKSLATSFLLVAGGIYALGSLDAGALERGLDAAWKIGAGLVGGFGIIKLLEWIFRDRKRDGELLSTKSGSAFRDIAKIIWAIAGAMALVFVAVTGFSLLYTFNKKGMDAGLQAVTALMVEFGLLIGALEVFSKWGEKTGSSKTITGIGATFKGIAPIILSLAIAIDLLMVAVGAFGVMASFNAGAAWQGIAAISIIMLEFGTLLGVMTKIATESNGGVAIKASGLVLAVALATILMMIPVKVLADEARTNAGAMWQGVVATMIIIAALGGLVGAFAGIAKDLGSSKGGILKTIGILASVVIAVGAVLWELQQWPVNISFMDALAFDMILGMVLGMVASLSALSHAGKAADSVSSSGGFWSKVGDTVLGIVDITSVLSEVVVAIGLLLEALNTYGIKFNVIDAVALDAVLAAVIGFVTAIAGIREIGALLDKPKKDQDGKSLGEKWGQLGVEVVGDVTILAEVIGTIGLLLKILNENKIPAFFPIDTFKEILTAVGTFIAGIAAIREGGALLSNKFMPSKTFKDKMGDLGYSIAGEASALVELLGSLWMVVYLLSTYEIKASWTKEKIGLVEQFTVVIATVAKAFAEIDKVGSFLSSILNKTGSGATSALPGKTQSKGQDLIDIGLNVLDAVGQLAPIVGLLWATLELLSKYTIDDSWTTEKIKVLEAMLLGLAGVAKFVVNMKVPMGQGSAIAAFKAGLTVDAFIAPIVALIEGLALIDAAFSSITITTEDGKTIHGGIGDFIDRLLDPYAGFFDSLKESVGGIIDALKETNKIDPEKARPFVDLIALVATMDDNSSKISNLVSAFTGENEWTAIGTGLSAIMTSMGDFIEGSKKINPLALYASLPLISAVGELVDHLRLVKGTGFEYVYDWEINYFIENVTKLINAVSSVDIDKLKSIPTIVQGFKDLVIATADINSPDGSTIDQLFAEAFSKLVSEGIVENFCYALENADAERLQTAFDDFKTTLLGYADDQSALYEALGTASNDLAHHTASVFEDYFNPLNTSSTFSTKIKTASKCFLEVFKTYFTSTSSGSAKTSIIAGFRGIAGSGVSAFANEFYSTNQDVVRPIQGAASRFENITKPYFAAAGSNTIQAFINAMIGRLPEVYSVGANIMQGLINGMNALAPAVMGTANSISSSVGTSMARAMVVRSPSRITTQLGEYIDQGLINGMVNKSKDVWNASHMVAIGVSDVMDSIIQNATYAMEQDANPTITPVVDMSNVTRSADYINGLFSGGTVTAKATVENAKMANIGSVRSLEYQNYAPIDYNAAIDRIDARLDSLATAITNMQIVMDSGALVGQIAAPMDNALGRRYMHQTRRN